MADPRPIGFPRSLLVDGGLRLREWRMRAADYEALDAARRDPDFVASLDSATEFLEADASDLVVALRERSALHGDLLGLAICTEDDRPIGTLMFERVDAAPDEWEAGVWVTEASRGNRVAIRAANAAIEWFARAGARTIWAQAIDERSANAAKAAGFVVRSTWPPHLERAGAGVRLLERALQQSPTA